MSVQAPPCEIIGPNFNGLTPSAELTVRVLVRVSYAVR